MSSAECADSRLRAAKLTCVIIAESGKVSVILWQCGGVIVLIPLGTTGGLAAQAVQRDAYFNI